MRIVLAVNGSYMYYGLPKYYYFLGKRLTELGVDVTYVLDSTSGANRLLEVHNEAKFHIIDMPTTNYLNTALYSHRLSDLLSVMNFDILHTCHVNPYFYLHRRRRKPVIFQPFGSELFSLEPFLSGITRHRYRLTQPILRYCGQRCDVLLAEGEFHIPDMVKWYRRGIEAIRILPVGIDIEFVRSQVASTMRTDNRFTVLCVSSLHKWEGVDTALRAFTYIKGALGDARFVLIGTGPEKKRLMALAHSLGVQDSLQHMENVPENKLYHYYAMADMLICPTLEQDEQMSVLEAIALGLPVVSTGQPWLVKGSRTGYAVPPGDVGQMAGAIGVIYTLKTKHKWNPEEFEKAIVPYDFKSIAVQAQKIYREVLQ